MTQNRLPIRVKAVAMTRRFRPSRRRRKRKTELIASETELSLSADDDDDNDGLINIMVRVICCSLFCQGRLLTMCPFIAQVEELENALPSSSSEQDTKPRRKNPYRTTRTRKRSSQLPLTWTYCNHCQKVVTPLNFISERDVELLVWKVSGILLVQS